MPRPPRLAVFAALAGIAAAGLGIAAGRALGLAQEKPKDGEVVHETAGVTLIEIPVNVVGKDGKPMGGLKLEDFELTDEGKKQPLSGMDVIDLSKADAAAPSGASSVPAAARRLWLLVFDLTYTSPSGLVRARDGARKFVTEAMKPTDLAAAGTLSVDTGWKLLVNFTRDRKQLAYAIDTLGLTPGEHRTTDPLSFAFTAPGPGGDLTSMATGGKMDSVILENIRDLQRMQKQANDDLSRGRVTKLVGTLAGIGRTLDSARGRKHVLYFSEGFETRLLAGHMANGDKSNSLSQNQGSAALDTSTPQGMGDAALSGEIWKIDNDTRYGNSATRTQMLDALTLFNRSDAVLDAIDISGLRADGDASGSKAGSGTDALFAMAEATEGDLVRNANTLAPELGKIEERSALVYLLIYQPKNLSKPGAFHALKIKVRAPGARVLARSGYYEPRSYQSLSPLEKILAAGDLLTGGSRENTLSANLMAAPFASQADLPQVPVLLEIPGAGLLAGETGAQTTLQIYIYANDAAGTLADYLVSEMSLDLGKVRAGLEAGGLKYYGTLYLPPGQYGVRALVRSVGSGRTGVFSTSVTVPEIPGKTPTVLPPFFEEPAGRWLMVRGAPRADAPARPADYPFAIAGDSFIPSALGSIAASDTARVAVVAYNFGAPVAKPEPLDVRAEILGADGKSRPAPVTVASRSDVERGAGRKVVLDFKPQGLTPGRYALKVAVTDPTSKKTAEASSPFEVK
ncbi:MAG TPA: VWA domain-containing protein [Thermoanaerobaculia bacterium]